MVDETDAEIAIIRLTAWVRDYGDTKGSVFAGDVSMLLLIARESLQNTTDLRQAIAIKNEALERVALMTPFGHDGMDDLVRSAMDASANQADMTGAKIRAALAT
ncbi:MAG: hypothetical protein GY903_26195 [Fuerstiella sp.]|nr:hypothetical protein [Fuerstiella sp.]MCP4857989.1 hypothetical protein [Fuerstiella sp.]